MLDARQDQWLTDRHQAVLVTLRRDGRAQSSNVVFSWREDHARVSVTADRAKTHNLRRDPRAVLHVLGDDFWSYLAVSASVELTATAAEAEDAVVAELADIYAHVAGAAHPDPQDFAAAMIAERRLVLRLHPTSAAGNPG